MIVRMWMAADPVTIGPNATLTEAATLMARRHIRRLPVLDDRRHGSHLAGMLSASDILRAFPRDENPFAAGAPKTMRNPVAVAEIMSRELVTTTPETPIEEAAALMCDSKIGALPVLREQRLIGLITESDIFRAFVSFLASAEAGIRITFDLSKREDVFAFIAEAARRRDVRVVSLISSQQDNQPVCVVRLAGEAVNLLLDDVWNSGHTVLNVIRFP